MNPLFFYIIKINLLLTISLISFSLQSQTIGADIITLKDGTTHRGTVIEQKPGKHLKLVQLPSFDTLLIELKTIDLLSKNLTEPSKTNNDSVLISYLDLQKLKMFNVNNYHLELNYAIGGGDFSVNSLGVSLMKTVNTSTQAGLSFSYLSDIGQQSSYKNSFPICAELSYELREHVTGRTSILVNLSAGYNMMIGDSFIYSNTGEKGRHSDGFYLNPSLGYRLNLFQESGIMLNIGYQLITSKGYSSESGDLLTKRNWDNFLFTGSFFF